MPKSRAVKKGGRKAIRKAVRKAATRSARKATTKRKPAARGAAAKRAPAKKTPAPRAIRHGVVTHTELASADPLATRAWCEKVLGWKFVEAMPTPEGPYHMWRSPIETGGGIRANNPPEVPGSIPYCEVRDIREIFAKAIAAGATEMLSPMALPEGMGFVAIVAAPGGVPIGFWSMK